MERIESRTAEWIWSASADEVRMELSKILFQHELVVTHYEFIKWGFILSIANVAVFAGLWVLMIEAAQ